MHGWTASTRWARAKGAARAVPSLQRHLTSKSFSCQSKALSHIEQGQGTPELYLSIFTEHSCSTICISEHPPLAQDTGFSQPSRSPKFPTSPPLTCRLPLLYMSFPPAPLHSPVAW